MDLDSQPHPSHLERSTRLLVLTQVAIWPADWPQFDAILRRAQIEGVARATIDEVLLQAVLFFGFPRLVSAFERLQAVWPQQHNSTSPAVPTEQRSEAGRSLFAAIYGKNDVTVRSLLASFHQEFHDFVLEAAYGRILARKGLDARTRELIAVGALAVLRQLPQLVAHGRGAITFGASSDAVREAIHCAIDDKATVDELMQRIQRGS